MRVKQIFPRNADPDRTSSAKIQSLRQFFGQSQRCKAGKFTFELQRNSAGSSMPLFGIGVGFDHGGTPSAVRSWCTSPWRGSPGKAVLREPSPPYERRGGNGKVRRAARIGVASIAKRAVLPA